MEVIQNFIYSFNPVEAFGSLRGLLGSGYLFVIITCFFLFGLVHKLVKVAILACVCYAIWLLWHSGFMDTVFLQLQSQLR